VSEPDFDHVRNVVRDAFSRVPPRFAPAIAHAVEVHYQERTPIADSSLSDVDPPEPLISAAERIIAVVNEAAGDDAATRGKCLEIVHELAETRTRAAS
jgi:hypothetical protein